MSLNDLNNDQPILITFIIPMFNLENYIGCCLDSIRGQTYSNWEAILVDDGSIDRTGEICRGYCKVDKRFELIAKENSGCSSAKNVGLSRARGKYVMFVDGDDWIDPDCARMLVRKATETNAEITVCEYYKVKSSTGEKRFYKLQDDAELSFQKAICDDSSGYGGHMWNKLILRSRITHSFHEEIHYYEDLLFLLENSSSDTTYAVVHKPLYYYRTRSGSAMHARCYDQKMLTALTALRIIMDLVPFDLIDYYKYVWMNRVCWLETLSKRSAARVDLTAEKEMSRRYYPDVLHSRDVAAATKAKAFIIRHVPRLYGLYMDRQK